jgi:hypothetical protein
LESSSIEKYNILSDSDVKERIEQAIIEFGRRSLGVNVRIILHLILDSGKTRRSVNVKIRESNEVMKIGADSQKLLIGAFVSKQGLPERILNSIKNKVLELLVLEGVKDMISTEDPMGQPFPILRVNGQLDLI